MLPCGDLVKASGLLRPITGAALPADKTVGEWIAFADRHTGQLDKANAGAILDTCERWQAKAAAAAKTRPWWRFWVRSRTKPLPPRPHSRVRRSSDPDPTGDRLQAALVRQDARVSFAVHVVGRANPAPRSACRKFGCTAAPKFDVPASEPSNRQRPQLCNSPWGILQRASEKPLSPLVVGWGIRTRRAAFDIQLSGDLDRTAFADRRHRQRSQRLTESRQRSIRRRSRRDLREYNTSQYLPGPWTCRSTAAIIYV